MNKLTSIIFALLCCMLAASAQAGQMQIAPVVVELTAPASASSVQIKNTGNDVMSVQARLFGWTQKKGADSYFRTKDVVVSPPILKLAPGKSGIIRIVRLTKKPISGEESYRLIVDELPKLASGKRSTVSLVLRHSIPVFFSNPASTSREPSWTAVRRNGKLYIQGTNSGETRVKFSQLKLMDQSGNLITSGRGVNGYILGKSSKSFATNVRKKLTGRKIQLSAKSNLGNINKMVKLKN